MKRAENQKVWLYKLRPSVVEGQYKKSNCRAKIIKSYLKDDELEFQPNQLRWKAIPKVQEGDKTSFVEGLTSLIGAGEPSMKQGISIYGYSANVSMGKTAFYNSDGDFIIVPQTGTLYLRTLNGKMTVEPWEFCVIPRGIKFSIDVEGQVSGWICELFGQHPVLPELGPIGANGLANPGHFQHPTAWFEDKKEEWTVNVDRVRSSTSTLGPFTRRRASSALTMWWAGEATTRRTNTTCTSTTPSAPSASTTPTPPSSLS